LRDESLLHDTKESTMMGKAIRGSKRLQMLCYITIIMTYEKREGGGDGVDGRRKCHKPASKSLTRFDVMPQISAKNYL